MPRVIVTTDDGQPVWQMEDIESWHITALQCPTNVRGSAVASGVRRAVRDAAIIQQGGDPERPSEKAMRMMAEARSRSEQLT
jgi:hypothetical protein